MSTIEKKIEDLEKSKKGVANLDEIMFIEYEIEQLKRQLEEEKKENISTTQSNTTPIVGKEFIEEGWDVPMPSKNSTIQDKKMDYKILGLITLISNRKTEFIEGIDISEEEMHRYIYEKGTNSILSNKEYLEQISKYKYDSIKKVMRKLEKADNDVITYCEDRNGKKYYKIMPYEYMENQLCYVKVDSRILEYLCNVASSNTIKVYCNMLWLLWDNENKCYREREITRDFLCKHIGLSEKAEKNVTMVGDCLSMLCSCGILQRKKETITIERKGCNIQVKTVYKYFVPNIEFFLENKNK